MGGENSEGEVGSEEPSLPFSSPPGFFSNSVLAPALDKKTEGYKMEALKYISILSSQANPSPVFVFRGPELQICRIFLSLVTSKESKNVRC